MSSIYDLFADQYPERIRWTSLGELGNTYNGLSGKSKKDFQNGNSRFVSYKNIFNNISVHLYSNEFVYLEAGETQNYIKMGDILFTGSSETKNDVGMSSVVLGQPKEKIYLNSFCFGFRFQDQNLILPGFSKYLFRCRYVRKQIVNSSNGVTRFNISKKRFNKIVIPIPPLKVQQEIVKILDTFTELEAELEARRKQYTYYRDKLLDFDDLSTRGG